MFKVEFGLMQEVKTGNKVRGFFGEKDEIYELWVRMVLSIVAGGPGYDGFTLLMADDGTTSFFDFMSEPDEDGIRSNAYKENTVKGLEVDWQDVRDVKVYFEKD